MKIALIQLALTESMEENLQKALNSMDEAASQGAELVCFPEIQFSPFFPQYPSKDVSGYAIPIEHYIVKSLQAKCRSQNLVGFPNFYLQEGQQRYDASPVIDSDGSC